MRIDVVTIFPDYLAPLRLSLPGKAQDAGLLDVRVHDLRDWTHDRHRTVDDTPYGGGAGMVMRAEPWGEVLDDVAPGSEPGTVLVVPTPSGVPLTQRLAAELAGADRLVVACGRYEGIDQRVLDHAVARMRVLEVSLGDYVLNGGEVAALVITEAVVRLLPGFMGNPESLTEESHGDSGLLEYPVYTRPASWRGLDVPAVLLSGDHRAVAAWRHEQAVARTAARRPDLLHPSQALDVAGRVVQVRTAVPSDAGEILTLQLACWADDLRGHAPSDVPPPGDDLADVRAWLVAWTTFVVHAGSRLVAAVRARLEDGVWVVQRLLVAPDLRDRGLSRRLLEHVESAVPPAAERIAVRTEGGSEDDLRMLKAAGYRLDREQPGVPGAVHLSRPVRRRG